MKANFILIAALAATFALSATAATTIDYATGQVSIAGTFDSILITTGADIGLGQDNDSLVLSGFDHTVTIAGGIIRGDINSSGFRHQISISGGVIGGDIELWAADNVVTFYGSSLVFTGTAVSGNVTGILSDGSPIDVNIVGGASNAINLVPEPSPILLIALGIIPLSTLTRRR